MNEHRHVLLLKGKTQVLTEAVLVKDFSQEEVRRVDALWSPFLDNAVRSSPVRGQSLDAMPEHSHWSWERKWRHATVNSQFFGIECEGEIQAMMIVRIDKFCRLIEQIRLPLIYVDYLAVAPWNLPEVTARPKFRGSGLILIAEAVQLSQQTGYNGRVGLHSLSQAEDFYRRKCGMTDLGVDTNYEGLRYLEMTAVQAEAFLEKTR